MRMLVCNANYTVIISRSKRTAQKTLSSFPVEKIYNSEGILIFDADTITTENKNNKTKYCQKFVCELFIEELEKLGYSFEKLQTKKATKLVDGLKPVTLTKIVSVEIPQIVQERTENKQQLPMINGRKLNMNKMEETIGKDCYETLKTMFDNDAKINKIVFGNTNYIMNIYEQLCQQGILNVGYDIYLGEGYGERIEQLYVNNWNMTLNTFLEENNQQANEYNETSSTSTSSYQNYNFNLHCR